MWKLETVKPKYASDFRVCRTIVLKDVIGGSELKQCGYAWWSGKDKVGCVHFHHLGDCDDGREWNQSSVSINGGVVGIRKQR